MLFRSKQKLGEICDLNGAASVLGWDQQTYMPSGSGAARAEQLATLGKLAHELLVADCVGECLDAAMSEVASLPADSDEVCLLRVLRREYDKARKATSGRDALAAFRAAEFDLVITDHVMARMNGHQLAAAIKELRPDVPLILLTGYAEHSAAESPRPAAVDLVLAKPLSRTALRHALARVMAL